MILAIDVGNTHVVVGVMEDLETKYSFRLQTDPKRTDAEYAVLMHQTLKLAGYVPTELEGAIISSVVPPVTALLEKAVKLVCGCDAMVIGPHLDTGLKIHIDDPSTLGADLLVGAVAALDKYPAPIIIVDMGTATTVTCVDKSRRLLFMVIRIPVTESVLL